MPPIDPIQIILAWVLTLAGAFSAWMVLARRAADMARAGHPYRIWHRVRDVATPLGLAALGARALLVGYRLVPPNGPASFTIMTVATVGFVGGIAASRIRRFPG